MNPIHDTQPNMRAVRPGNDGGPPRLLLFGVIGFCMLFILGAIAVPIVFREVLSPAQQQRIMDQLPFMAAFKEPTPMGGILPTVDANPELENNAMNLLNMPLMETTPTADAQAVVQPSATPLAATQVPTVQSSPTTAATATAIPSTEEAAGSQSIVGAPTATAVPDLSGQSSTVSLPVADSLPGFKWVKQTWNNCGPATLTMSLGYYGWTQDQAYASSYLKPNREDKNVSPYELTNFVNTQTGVRALTRIGGDINLLKSLVVSNFPVIIETSAMFEAYDWLGHYRLVVGYDDNSGQVFVFDTFAGVGPDGRGVQIGYKQFDADWQDFNRTFIVIYQQEREAELMQLLGTRASEESAAEHAFNVAQEEAKANAQDSFAWFNMGTALVKMGRYEEAANAYDQARRYELPWRMLWYQFGPFEAYFKTGRYDEVLVLAQTNLNSASELEESYYWRGQVFAAQGRKNEAASEYNTALSYNENFTAAREALQGLRR